MQSEGLKLTLYSWNINLRSYIATNYDMLLIGKLISGFQIKTNLIGVLLHDEIYWVKTCDKF